MSDLEKRVTAIEVKLATVETKVDGLTHMAREAQTDMKSLIKSVGDVTGRVAQLPGTWAIAGWSLSVALSVAGLVFAIARTLK